MLSSLCEKSSTGGPTARMNLYDNFQCAHDIVSHSFLDYAVTLKSTGAFLVRECHHYQQGCAYPKGNYACKSVDLPFEGPFPWILKIGVTCNQLVSMTLHCK